MTVKTNAGTRLRGYAGTMATYGASSPADLPYIEIAEVISIGEHGGSTSLVTHNPLATRRTKKAKGAINDGSMPVAMGMDITDAGQLLLKNGALGANIDVEHSFEIEYQDGSKEYFTAVVMSYTRNPSTIDAIVGANTTLELTDNVIDPSNPFISGGAIYNYGFLSATSEIWS